MSLQGKVALVTGAGGGIGQGIAVALATAGADVIVHVPADVSTAAETLRQIEATGRKAVSVEADFSHPAPAARQVLLAALDAFGRVDILVNNAGVTITRPFLDLEEEVWDQTFNINLKTLFLLSQASARQMLEKKLVGRIINIGSVHGFQTLPSHGHYAATKGALKMLTQAMALELAAHKITVNAVAPGAVEVERYFNNPRYDTEAYGHAVPVQRIGYPADIAHTVVFLCGAEAEWITGQVFYVDGGMLAALPWNPPGGANL